MKKEEMCVNCVFCEMNNGVAYCTITGGTNGCWFFGSQLAAVKSKNITEADGYYLTFKKEKDKKEKKHD